jgi:hypothetical protein
MKDIARSRTTYYSLAREILIKKHPKVFNILLILALISMTGLAVFLISDILSFGSNSSYKGALAGIDLLEKGKSILKNDQGLLAANNSDNKKGNLSEIKNLSRQSGAPGPSSSSRMGNSSPASLTSGGVVVSNISSSISSNKPTNNKKDSTKRAIYHSHSSGSSASSSKSAKESKIQSNLTQAKIIELNKTSMNQSGLNTSLAKELKLRNILTLYSVGNNSNSNRSKDGIVGKDLVRMEFKTDLTTKSKSEKSLDSAGIGGGTITGSDIRSDSKYSEAVPAEGKNTVADSSKGSTTKSSIIAQKNVGKPAQTSRVTSGAKSQNRLQAARDRQIANRNRLINNRKSQATQSRAIPQRRSQPTR